jgi:coenzyme PQQ precursor peptide PqqA
MRENAWASICLLLGANCSIVLSIIRGDLWLADAVHEYPQPGGKTMKEWTKPQVTEQEVGLEVTSYVAAEIQG